MSEGRKPVGVIVSQHASDRMRERFPRLESANVVGHIVWEVQQALEAGRRSTKPPRWVAMGLRHKMTGTHRYVWNEEETRCYPIVKNDGSEERRGEFRETWWVRTVLPRLDEEGLRAADEWRKGIKQNTGNNKSERRGRRRRH